MAHAAQVGGAAACTCRRKRARGGIKSECARCAGGTTRGVAVASIGQRHLPYRTRRRIQGQRKPPAYRCHNWDVRVRQWRRCLQGGRPRKTLDARQVHGSCGCYQRRCGSRCLRLPARAWLPRVCNRLAGWRAAQTRSSPRAATAWLSVAPLRRLNRRKRRKPCAETVKAPQRLTYSVAASDNTIIPPTLSPFDVDQAHTNEALKAGNINRRYLAASTWVTAYPPGIFSALNLTLSPTLTFSSMAASFT